MRVISTLISIMGSRLHKQGRFMNKNKFSVFQNYPDQSRFSLFEFSYMNTDWGEGPVPFFVENVVEIVVETVIQPACFNPTLYGLSFGKQKLFRK